MDRLQEIRKTLEFIQTHEDHECEGYAENSYVEDVTYLLAETARLYNLIHIVEAANERV